MLFSVIFARGLEQALSAAGKELPPGMLDSQRLLDLTQMFELDEARQLVRTARSLLADPSLGLTFGSQAPLGMLQVFGHLLMAQPTLREAFAVLERYSGLIAEGVRWRLSEQGKLAELVFEPMVEVGTFTHFVVEYALTTACRVGERFVPDSALLERARFRHPPPSYWLRYTQVFQCPVEFGQEENALRFPRDYLDRAQAHADSFVDGALRAAADQLLARRGTPSLGQRVRHVLEHEHNLAHFDADSLARRLGISSYMLRTGLRSEKLQLATLLDDARGRIAREELLRPGATIEDTARRLGYFDRSSFHRAFRRWTGQTPRAFLLRTGRSSQPGRRTSARPSGSTPRS